jgi:hypothetical protein
MKKIIFSLLLSMFVVAIVTAQPPQRSMGPRGKVQRPSRENVEALKVAFMTKHLNLNPDEAQKFWPAYNACTEELKKARQEKKEDVLAFEEAALNIRKKYKNEFKKVLGSDERANKALTADRAFMGMIKDELQNRKGMHKKGSKLLPPPPPPGQQAPTL